MLNKKGNRVDAYKIAGNKQNLNNAIIGDNRNQINQNNILNYDIEAINNENEYDYYMMKIKQISIMNLKFILLMIILTLILSIQYMPFVNIRVNIIIKS